MPLSFYCSDYGRLEVIWTIIDTILSFFTSAVRGLQSLKNALGLPLRLGWNGDPCVPQQHPWSGADCQFDKTSNKWVIDGMYVNELTLRYTSFYLYVCLCGRIYGISMGIFKNHLHTPCILLVIFSQAPHLNIGFG